MSRSHTKDVCYTCPYGGYIAIPIVFSLLGLVFFYVTAFGCYSFEMKQDKEYRDYEYTKYTDCGPLEWTSPIGLSTDRANYGFWFLRLAKYEGVSLTNDLSLEIQLTTECKSWDKIETCYEIDAPLKAGRAIGIIGAVLTAVVFIFVSFASCVVYPNRLLQVAGAVTILASFLSLVLFVGIATDICSEPGFSCRPDAAGYMAIPSFCFLLIAGLSMFFMKKRVLEEDSPPPAESPLAPVPYASAQQAAVATMLPPEAVPVPVEVISPPHTVSDQKGELEPTIWVQNTENAGGTPTNM